MVARFHTVLPEYPLPVLVLRVHICNFENSLSRWERAFLRSPSRLSNIYIVLKNKYFLKYRENIFYFKIKYSWGISYFLREISLQGVNTFRYFVYLIPPRVLESLFLIWGDDYEEFLQYSVQKRSYFQTL